MLPTDLQSPASKAPLSFSKLLLVEGSDAFYFFKALLQHLNLLFTIEIRNYGGAQELAMYLRTLPVISGFAGVTSVGVVRDAESAASSAFQSVCQGLGNANFSVPTKPLVAAEGRPAVSVFILPDCHRPGMLETLCLEAVAKEMAMTCVEEYFQCLKKRGVPISGNLAKARLHAFLASRPRPHLLLGQAAHEGYLPWDSPAFEKLKEFLKAL